jgi:hypothetical protein
MENTEQQEIKGFKINASINYEIKFGENGLEMTYEPKTDANKLFALLISHDVAMNAKANFNENIHVVKQDKMLVDRLNKLGQTINGIEILIDSFTQALIEANTSEPKEEIKVADLIKKVEAKIESGEVVPSEIKLDTTITKQDIPTEE